MDMSDELERLAFHFKAEIHEPDAETAQRWRNIFHTTDPYTVIMGFRKSLDSHEVSDAHWNAVREGMEVQGHDRESYSYSLTLTHPITRYHRQKQQAKNDRGRYLLKLLPSCTAISSPQAVKKSAALSSEPAIHGDEDSDTTFVELSAEAKVTLDSLLSSEHPNVHPTFIRLTLPSPKSLDAWSIYPTLGKDSTLPHLRPSSMNPREDLIQQCDYPVWYFFYGTLANSDVLRQKLAIDDTRPINYEPAWVRDAKLTTWGGKYNALIDGVENVLGSAYSVKDEAQEEKLRTYETDHYEVVRCEMVMEGGNVRKGLTFRFIA